MFEVTDLEVRAQGSKSGREDLNTFPTFVGNSVPFTLNRETVALGYGLVSNGNWDQSVSLFRSRPTDDGGRRTVSFEDNTELAGLSPILGMGWRIDKQWSIGFNGVVDYVNLDDLRTSTMRLTDADGRPIERETVSSRLRLEVWNVRLGFGANYRAGDHWRFGAAINTPSWEFVDSGKVLFDVAGEDATSTFSGRLRDEDVDVQIRRPASVAMGAAYVAPLWELELDLTVFADPGDYEVFAIDDSVPVEVQPKNSDPSTTTNEVIPGTRSANRATIIAAVGGHYKLSPQIDFHGGVSFNSSPVEAASDESAFRDYDFWSLSLGFSRSTQHVSTVLGLRYSFADDDGVRTSDLISGQSDSVDLSVDILTFGVSTAYRF